MVIFYRLDSLPKGLYRLYEFQQALIPYWSVLHNNKGIVDQTRSYPTTINKSAMEEKVSLSASLEDYIEAIYHIIDEKLVARSKEIAARLDVSRASVTEALRALAKKGLINYEPYEAITMTDLGKEVAEDVIFRHEALKSFFIEVLAIDKNTAEEAACKVEHTAPQEVINKMVSFTQFLKVCPRGGTEMIKGFADFCKQGKTRLDCEECVASCLDITPESKN